MARSRPANPTRDRCPCGSGQALAQCCGRWHAGEAAPSAEALMRSRYSAFVLGLTDYLLRSWHPSTRPTELGLESERQWLGLRVVATGQQDPDHATVEFIARSRVGGQSAQRLHELSRFERVEGHWLYVDGDLRG